MFQLSEANFKLVTEFLAEIKTNMLSKGELDLIHRSFGFACKLCIIPLDCDQDDEQGFILKKTVSKWKSRFYNLKTCICFCVYIFPFIRFAKAWEVYKVSKDLEAFLHSLIVLDSRACGISATLSIFLFGKSISYGLNNMLGFNAKYGK